MDERARYFRQLRRLRRSARRWSVFAGTFAGATAVERALTRPGADETLRTADGELLGHFTGGVEAYEGLVAAAAGYVAQDGRVTDQGAVTRLTEATAVLRATADGLAELTTVTLRTTGDAA